MATKKPIVLSSGSDMIEEIQSGDTLSTSDITDSTNKRLLTDGELSTVRSSKSFSVAMAIALG